ncbi:hypothetical protein ABZ252_21905 [Streptomyces sp. NPDC006175]|uniref:hypothetical protein n=1 Tax=unclassified Streptomyces TaxID=2593676 RepID=UPI0033BFA5F3
MGAVGARTRHQADGGIDDVLGGGLRGGDGNVNSAGHGVRGAGAGRGECGSGGGRRATEKSQDGEEQRGKKVPHLVARRVMRSRFLSSRGVRPWARCPPGLRHRAENQRVVRPWAEGLRGVRPWAERPRGVRRRAERPRVVRS